MAHPCCTCSCSWYQPEQNLAPADAWWKEAIRHETENRWYVRQLPGAWAATFGGSQVDSLIKHQVETPSDRSFRPYGRRVLAEPRESEDFRKAFSWEEPRAVPEPQQIEAVPRAKQRAVEPPVAERSEPVPVEAPVARRPAEPVADPPRREVEPVAVETPAERQAEPIADPPTRSQPEAAEPATQRRQAEPQTSEASTMRPETLQSAKVSCL